MIILVPCKFLDFQTFFLTYLIQSMVNDDYFEISWLFIFAFAWIYKYISGMWITMDKTMREYHFTIYNT